METASNKKQIQCLIVTPERTVVDEMVEFVAVPMYDGELGVLAGRAPLIGRLGPGELRTRNGKVVHRYFVDGGFVQIRGGAVTVLTPRAQKAEEIDPARAEQALKEKAPAASADARLRAQQRARVQMRIVRRLRDAESP